jgi:hypothetical protein
MSRESHHSDASSTFFPSSSRDDCLRPCIVIAAAHARVRQASGQCRRGFSQCRRGCFYSSFHPCTTAWTGAVLRGTRGDSDSDSHLTGILCRGAFLPAWPYSIPFSMPIPMESHCCQWSARLHSILKDVREQGTERLLMCLPE